LWDIITFHYLFISVPLPYNAIVANARGANESGIIKINEVQVKQIGHMRDGIDQYSLVAPACRTGRRDAGFHGLQDVTDSLLVVRQCQCVP